MSYSNGYALSVCECSVPPVDFFSSLFATEVSSLFSTMIFSTLFWLLFPHQFVYGNLQYLFIRDTHISVCAQHSYQSNEKALSNDYYYERLASMVPLCIDYRIQFNYLR